MNILICYRMNEHSKNTAGIFSKMLGQAIAFKALGHDVRLIYMSLNKITLSTMQPNGTLKLVRQFGPVAKEGERDKFWQLANEFVNAESWQVDILYARYDMMFQGRSFLDFLSDCKDRRIKVVVEFPTYPYALEISNEVDRQTDTQFVKDLNKYVDLIYSTSRLTHILGIKNEFFSNKLIVDRAKISLCEDTLIKPDGGLDILLVANFMPWHGYDRLLAGLKLYLNNYPNANLRCHFIGNGDELDNLKKLTFELKLTNQVFFYGFKSEEELVPYYSNASVCMGSLGLHRIGIFESSTLKVRSYLANGLPIVMANEDEDLDAFEYVLQIPLDDSPVEITQLVEFVSRCEILDVRSSIRQFASENLTWLKVCKALIDKLS